MDNRYAYSNTGRDLIRSENSPSDNDDKLYVAVSEDAKDSESTLLWAVRNSGGRKLCILHVHQPSEFIPILGKKHHVSTLPPYKVKAYRDTEKQVMINALEDCVRFCQKLGVSAEKLFVERESVEKGILEMISMYRIEKLVMGAAADKSYYRHSMEPVSRKATYVQLHSPVSCNIWFVYGEQLVYARESCLQSNQYAERDRSHSLQPSSSNASSSSGSSSQSSVRNYSRQMYSTSNAQLEENAGGDHYGPITRELVESGKRRQGTCGDLLWSRTFQLEAIFRLNEIERSFVKDLRRRKETEEELERMKGVCRQITEDLHLAENKIASFNVELRSPGEGKHGKFIDPYGETSSRKDTQISLSEFSFDAIVKATCDFDPSNQRHEYGYQSVYRGKLSETDVVIKILKPDETAEMQFQKEVEVLSKFRHPNLIMLMGECSEALALVYEYLPNGTLDERLRCNDNTPPLPWKTRICIAAELCSALIYCHSKEPHRLVHAALTPSCIYLDSNFSCKIGNFRSSHLIPVGENSVIDNSAPDDCVYMDPEFGTTREVSPRIDVYAFGIILLKLLTARTTLRLVEKVRYALRDHKFEQILDSSAGEWPSQAKQLAHLGLSCCEHTSDLKLDVWPVLEQMKRLNSDSNSRPSEPDEPPYFLCPILQEPMKDPHVAADGFTYEADALREWLNSGHDTSPMTNMRLPHLTLVPNLALRSAIKEWQDRRREQ